MKPKNTGSFMSNEERIAILETNMFNITATLMDIKQDVKRMSDRMDTRFDAMDQKFTQKIEALDEKFTQKLDVLNQKFEHKIDSKMDALEKKFDTKFDRLENRLWAHFIWLMTLIIGLAGIVAHAHHWV